MDVEKIWVKGISCTRHTSKHYLRMNNVVCYVALTPERMHSPVLFLNKASVW